MDVKSFTDLLNHANMQNFAQTTFVNNMVVMNALFEANQEFIQDKMKGFGKRVKKHDLI